MKASYPTFFFSLTLLAVIMKPGVNGDSRRRSLHQPFDPEIFVSPPSLPDYANSDQPTPAPSSIMLPTPASTQQLSKPIKAVVIAGSVAIVTLGMLSALAFFLHRQRKKPPRKPQMVVEGDYSQRLPSTSGIPQSSFRSIGIMEQRLCSFVEPKGENGDSSPPYRRLNSMKKLDSYILSPELQPLPSLSQHHIEKSPSETSMSDEESKETVFLTPEWSAAVCYDDASNPTALLGSSPVQNVCESPVKTEAQYNSPVVQAKGTSLLPYFQDLSIKQVQQRLPASPPSPPPPPPPTSPL